jgi:uncharacterized protein
MTISALAVGSQVLHEPRYLQAAEVDAHLIRARLYNPTTGRLKRRYREGSAEIDGFLGDYALMTQALLDLFEASADNADLVWALKLQKTQNAIEADAQVHGTRKQYVRLSSTAPLQGRCCPE